MSYNFKSLGEVELLNTIPETANVFVEVDGGIRRAPQAKPIDEIVGSETLEEVPENATAIVEVNGEIKRVSGKELGGSKNIIFHVPSEGVTECNYSPEEVHELLLSGANSILTVDFMVMNGGEESSISTFDAAGGMPIMIRTPSYIDAPMDDGSSCFTFNLMGNDVDINYFADGTIENSMFPAEPKLPPT